MNICMISLTMKMSGLMTMCLVLQEALSEFSRSGIAFLEKFLMLGRIFQGSSELCIWSHREGKNLLPRLPSGRCRCLITLSLILERTLMLERLRCGRLLISRSHVWISFIWESSHLPILRFVERCNWMEANWRWWGGSDGLLQLGRTTQLSVQKSSVVAGETGTIALFAWIFCRTCCWWVQKICQEFRTCSQFSSVWCKGQSHWFC